jgi:hypothetical protein
VLDAVLCCAFQISETEVDPALNFDALHKWVQGMGFVRQEPGEAIHLCLQQQQQQQQQRQQQQQQQQRQQQQRQQRQRQQQQRKGCILNKNREQERLLTWVQSAAAAVPWGQQQHIHECGLPIFPKAPALAAAAAAAGVPSTC